MERPPGARDITREVGAAEIKAGFQFTCARISGMIGPGPPSQAPIIVLANSYLLICLGVSAMARPRCRDLRTHKTTRKAISSPPMGGGQQ